MWLHWIRPEPSPRENQKVTDMIPAEGYTQETLLELAIALEAKSEHPLAKAVMQKRGRARKEGIRSC